MRPSNRHLNRDQKLRVGAVSETGFRFCAIDLQIIFLALALASKNYPKLSVKLAQFGTVSETWGLALLLCFTTRSYTYTYGKVGPLPLVVWGTSQL